MDTFDFEQYWKAISKECRVLIGHIADQVSTTAKKDLNKGLEEDGYYTWGGDDFLSFIEPSGSKHKTLFKESISLNIEGDYRSLSVVTRQGTGVNTAKISFCYAAYRYEKLFEASIEQFIIGFVNFTNENPSHIQFGGLEKTIQVLKDRIKRVGFKKTKSEDIQINSSNLYQNKGANKQTINELDTFVTGHLAREKAIGLPLQSLDKHSLLNTSSLLNERLIKSTEKGDFADIDLCLSHGADIDYQRNFDGATALHISLENEDKRICKFLLTKGARVNIQDFFGVDSLCLFKKSDIFHEKIIFNNIDGNFLRSNKHVLKQEIETCGYGTGYGTIMILDYDSSLPPLVQEGDYVYKGQSLGFMFCKNFGPIDIVNEYDGLLFKIFSEDNVKVEFKQPLFSLYV